MKRTSIRRITAAALLMIACGTVVCGGADPLRVAGQLGQAPATAAAEGTAAPKPQMLPTNSEVIRAVAAGVHVTQYPTQPAPIYRVSVNCHVSFDATSSPLCVYGDPHGPHTLVVYGDSHAAMWLPALDAIGKFAHWKVLQITKSSCQVPDYPSWLASEQRPYRECAIFRSFALAHIRQLHPDVVLLSSMYKQNWLVVNGRPTRQGLDAAWAAGLASMLVKIKPSTGRIIVLGDIAYNPQGGADCLAVHTNDVQSCNTPRNDAVFAAHNQMERRVTEQYGARYIDTIPWLCTATVCPAVVGGLGTHSDGNHVTSNYALWLADALGTATGLLPGGAA
ncbi:MAG: SGNH hydrolase domain-containing protein [Chloroflexota bacterium]